MRQAHYTTTTRKLHNRDDEIATKHDSLHPAKYIYCVSLVSVLSMSEVTHIHTSTHAFSRGSWFDKSR